MDMDGKTAIIIGAGPAGLTAAYELLKTTGIHPVILEADDCVGGISRTVEFKGNRMDIGGHRFFTKSDKIRRLWEEILPVTPLTSDATPSFLQRERVSRIFYKRSFFDYPVSLSADTLRKLGMGDAVGIGTSYIASCLHKRREETLEDFMINRFGRRLYETFFKEYTEKVWGRPPAGIGADWGSQRIKGVSLWAAVRDFVSRSLGSCGTGETSFVNRFLYPKLGPGQFFEELAKKVVSMGGEIRYGCKVCSLIADEGCITGVRYRLPDGHVADSSASFVFSSMPVKELATALPYELLPERLADVAVSLPYRDFMTAGLLVRRLETGKIPDDWIYIQEPGVKLGRLQVFNNWSPFLVADAWSTVWLGLEYFCQEGDALWNMDDRDFLQFAASELASIGIIRDDYVLDGCVVRMKKAYPAYFDSYKDFPAVREALKKIDGLYCIGRNGQHRYDNMDHAMMTSVEAVRAIKGLATQDNVWNVNTEESYGG